jgi:predicted nucleotidyltransferase
MQDPAPIEVDAKIQKNAMLPEIVEKLKKEYNPLKIILFGSYVYGNPTRNSDIERLSQNSNFNEK